MKKLGLNSVAWLLLLLAAILRFWKLEAFDFNHDEISALIRTDFSSFSDLIKQGVMVDGHPALVQVFLYAWSKWFAINPLSFKWPFALLGTLSLIPIWRIGQLKKTPHAALLTMCLIAVSQYFIWYSQLIRPYGPGLFFTLWAAFFYFRFFSAQRSQLDPYGFGFNAALAAYTHQFALLTVAIIGLHGLIKASKSERKWWWLAAGISLLVYLPHLPIFWAQLQLKGVGSWLGAPGWTFPLQYLHYLFHYSWVFIAFFLVSLVVGCRLSSQAWLKEGFIWFGLCFMVGFSYSHIVDPVLQFSVLLFPAPIFLLSSLSKLEFKKGPWPLGLIAAAGAFSLYAQRMHYPLSYVSPFAESHRQGAEVGNLIHHLAEDKITWYGRQNPKLKLQVQDLREISSLDSNLPTRFVLALDHSAPQHIRLALAERGFSAVDSSYLFGGTIYHYEEKHHPTEIKLDTLSTKEPYWALRRFYPADFQQWGEQGQVFALHYQGPRSAQPKLAAAFFNELGELLHWKGGKSQKDEIFIEVLPSEIQQFPVQEIRIILDQSQEKVEAISELHHASFPLNPRIYGQVYPF